MGDYGGLSLAGTLAGGVLNLLQQDRANQANVSIANANNVMQRVIHEQDNAFNRQERLEAQQYNLDMWNKQNAYNSPYAQAERLLAAGINPRAVMDADAAKSISPIASSSPASASSMPGLHSPQVQPLDMSFLGSAMMNYATYRKISSEAKGNEIDNLTRLQRNQNDLNLQLADIEQKLSQKDLNNDLRSYYVQQKNYLEVQQRYLDFQIDREKNLATYDDDMMMSQIMSYQDQHRNAWINYHAAEFNLELQRKYAGKIQAATLRNISAETANMLADEKLKVVLKGKTKEEMRKIIAERTSEILRQNGIRADNKVKAGIVDALVEKAVNEAYWSSQHEVGRDTYLGPFHYGKTRTEYVPGSKAGFDMYHNRPFWAPEY